MMERLAQCHCGSLRATTSGEPLYVGICHCKACQRRTGAFAASVAGFAKAQVTIEGQTKVFDRNGQSGRKVRFYFCPDCGTSLYWEADARPDVYILAVGAFALAALGAGVPRRPERRSGVAGLTDRLA